MVDISISVALAIVSLVTAYLGVHLTMHPPETNRTKWVYKSSFGLCAVVACTLIGIQAYRNQRASAAIAAQMGRIESNTKNPPTVEVNVPPQAPPNVVINSSTQPKEPGYLQYAGIIPTEGIQKVIVGQPLEMNYLWTNHSTEKLKNIADFMGINVIPPSQEAAMRKALSEERKKRAALMAHTEGTMGIGEGTPGFGTATSRPLTQAQVDGLNQGTMFVYMVVYLSWSDDRGIKGNLDECYIIATPQERPIVFKPGLMLRNCSYETRVH